MKYKVNFTIDEFKRVVLEFKPDCKIYSTFKVIRELIITIYGLTDTSQIAKLDAAIALHKVSPVNYLEYVSKKYNLTNRERIIFGFKHIFRFDDFIVLIIYLIKLHLEFNPVKERIKEMHIRLINAIEGFNAGAVTQEELTNLDLEHQKFNLDGTLTYDDVLTVYVDRSISILLKFFLNKNKNISALSVMLSAESNMILDALEHNGNEFRFLEQFNKMLEKYKVKEL